MDNAPRSTCITPRNERENHRANCTFCSMLDVMLPGGKGVAVVLHATFDESGTHEGAPVLCVAGYVAEPEQWKDFCKEWRCLLKKKGLPYLHMKTIKNRQGSERQQRFRPEEIEPLVVEFVDIIKKHIRSGLSVTMSAEEYRAITPHAFRSKMGGAEAMCAQIALARIGSDAKQDSYGPVVYYFAKGGPADGSLAQTIHELMSLKKYQRWRDEFQIGDYGFVDMSCAPPAQAADVLAYLSSTSWQFPPPPELVSLQQVKHDMIYLNRETIPAYHSTRGQSVSCLTVGEEESP